MSSHSILAKIERYIHQAIDLFHEHQIFFGALAFVVVIVMMLIWSFWLPKKSR